MQHLISGARDSIQRSCNLIVKGLLLIYAVFPRFKVPKPLQWDAHWVSTNRRPRATGSRLSTRPLPVDAPPPACHGYPEELLQRLAASSPDGHYVAYVTFEPRPRKGRPDLQFWGGTRVWFVALSEKPEPHPVTRKSLDETYGLRWLDDHVLVFDRVADVLFYKPARIWKAEVTP